MLYEKPEILTGRKEKGKGKKFLNKKTHPLSKKRYKMNQTSPYSAYRLSTKKAMFPDQRVCGYYRLWASNFSKYK